tara:strand:+ start:3984 stop:4160 length:177 start_codon:yes stop_codon:yes gene_type:complete
MPTVKYKCNDTGKMKEKKFPYNSVGKANASWFAGLKNSQGMKATITNNPTKGMTETGY